MEVLYVSETPVYIYQLILRNSTEELQVRVLNTLHNRGTGDKGTRIVGSPINGVQGD